MYWYALAGMKWRTSFPSLIACLIKLDEISITGAFMSVALS